MSGTLRKLENPGFVAPILVSRVLTLSDEELKPHLRRYLGECARVTYDTEMPNLCFEPSLLREQALELRPCKALSMNEIFLKIGLLDSLHLTDEQLERGAHQHPVKYMESLIESRLSEQAFLDAKREKDNLASSESKKKRSRKSKSDKRRRCLRKKAKKAAKIRKVLVISRRTCVRFTRRHVLPISPRYSPYYSG